MNLLKEGWFCLYGPGTLTVESIPSNGWSSVQSDRSTEGRVDPCLYGDEREVLDVVKHPKGRQDKCPVGLAYRVVVRVGDGVDVVVDVGGGGVDVVGGGVVVGDGVVVGGGDVVVVDDGVEEGVDVGGGGPRSKQGGYRDLGRRPCRELARKGVQLRRDAEH
ncbi:hypothetical protein K439DRAFT_1615688 [Ramaria rubella]|nr:hypothetical protein K439DRAFT_1615688 [Ramaria rubella]